MTNHVPILRQGAFLIVSIQDDLVDGDMVKLERRLLQEVIASAAKGVIIDVTHLDVLDSFGTRKLCNMVAAIQLRGARSVIVGIQPEVAISMVLLGLTLPNVAMALDLDAGLAHLNRRVGK